MNQVSPTEAARAALESVATMVVPTGRDDAGYDRARAAALALATERPDEVTVVLHDRSDERWTDTPHPDGPHGPDAVTDHGRPHLVEQMRPFTEAGVTVRAWYSSVPALTALIDPVQGTGADAVLVPATLEKPRVMDRLQPGRDLGAQVARVLEQNLDRAIVVLVVDEDDRVDLVPIADGAARE